MAFSPDVAPKFKVGELVWLEATNVNISRTRKLADRRLGPFPINKVVSEVNYELGLPHTMRIHPVFHVSLLTRHQQDVIPGRTQPPPPPVIIDGDEEYEVEEILNSKMDRRQLKYLVRWKGYSPAHDSWEPAEALGNAAEKVEQFHKDHPEAPRGRDQQKRR